MLFRPSWSFLVATVLAALSVVVVLLAVFIASPVRAAPFVVADVPAAECDKCVWGGGFPLINDVVVDATRGKATFNNRICMRDVVGALVGSNDITLVCRDTEGLWKDSVVVPFSFARPDLTPRDTRVVP